MYRRTGTFFAKFSSKRLSIQIYFAPRLQASLYKQISLQGSAAFYPRSEEWCKTSLCSRTPAVFTSNSLFSLCCIPSCPYRIFFFFFTIIPLVFYIFVHTYILGKSTWEFLFFVNFYWVAFTSREIFSFLNISASCSDGGD